MIISIIVWSGLFLWCTISAFVKYDRFKDLREKGEPTKVTIIQIIGNVILSQFCMYMIMYNIFTPRIAEGKIRKRCDIEGTEVKKFQKGEASIKYLVPKGCVFWKKEIYVNEVWRPIDE